MFRTSLLAATALVLCVSAAFAGRETGHAGDRIVPRFLHQGTPVRTLHGFPVVLMDRKAAVASAGRHGVTPRYPNAIFDNIDWHDKNNEWLSYYGFSIVEEKSCFYQSSQSHYCFSEHGNNAFAFYGTGKKAKKIGVPLFTESPSSTEYNVGIYSATASGLPGDTALAGGSTTASESTICCTQIRWVDVNVKLKKGEEYFLEVSCGAAQSYCYGGWMMEDTGQDYFHMAEHETYNFGSGTQTYSYSSPWHASTALGPAEGAAIIK
jgi:hypothetical protein